MELWPGGARAAVSLSFDDGRVSQLDRAVPILDAHGIKATFYLCAQPAEKEPARWRRAAEAGHEIGNHTATHPCTGNFPWARGKALEDFTLDRMEEEIRLCDQEIERAIGIRPRTFAYPCGQTFVGRGEGVKSYVPLVARRFLAGRGYLCEFHNDPERCDLAQVGAIRCDAAPHGELARSVEEAVAAGAWLVFAGHEVGDRPAPNATRADALEALCRMLAGRRDVWAATIADVAARAAAYRGAGG